MMDTGIKELRQRMGTATRLIGLDHSPTRIGVAMVAACRPWEFSALNALKRR